LWKTHNTLCLLFTEVYALTIPIIQVVDEAYLLPYSHNALFQTKDGRVHYGNTGLTLTLYIVEPWVQIRTVLWYKQSISSGLNKVYPCVNKYIGGLVLFLIFWIHL